MEVEDVLTELDIILDWFEVGDTSGKNLAKLRLEKLIKELEL